MRKNITNIKISYIFFLTQKKKACAKPAQAIKNNTVKALQPHGIHEAVDARLLNVEIFLQAEGIIAVINMLLEAVD